MRKIVTIVLLAAVLSLLLWGAFRERHPVASLAAAAETVDYDGLKFTEASTNEGVARKDGKLIDSYSLSPAALQEKDCKT